MSIQTLATRLFRRDGTRIRVVDYVQARPPTSRPRVRSRRQAFAVLGWFIVAFVLIHAAMVVAMDAVWPQLRDPEYGRRAVSLRKRIEEHPDRPLVLLIGSSRTGMGVKPSAWEATRPGTAHDPLLFNLTLIGSGPITELLTVRRAYADGFRPAVVLIEYWPPLLRQDGQFAETTSINPHRLWWRDQPVIADYFPDPEKTKRRMWTSRLNVLRKNHDRLLVQVDPELLRKPGRPDVEWSELDGWGWLPGMDPELDDDATHRRLMEHQRSAYRDRFRGFQIHPDSDRALREAVAVARAHGAQVGFLYLPETAEFQTWYPPEIEKAAQDHLQSLQRELDVPVINARNWMDKRYLADGFHLSRIGAEAFTVRLGPAISATFPELGGPVPNRREKP